MKYPGESEPAGHDERTGRAAGDLLSQKEENRWNLFSLHGEFLVFFYLSPSRSLDLTRRSVYI
jgi:hypothetical protein